MATLPVSPDRSKKLREHLNAIGKTYYGSITEMVDSLIDAYLNSPIKDLREREQRITTQTADRIRKLESTVRNLQNELKNVGQEKIC